MRLLLATTNEGKIRELRKILGDEGFEVIGLDDLETQDDLETGSTFAENALLKARYYHRLSGMPTIADDSGLAVDALNGAPGVYSARFAGVGATDPDRNLKLLEEMKDVPDEKRGAEFVCVAAFVWEGGEKIFTGTARGRLTREPRGTGGFGYDPLFFYEPFGKTFAQLTHEEKTAVSHRGKAFQQLTEWLKATF
ncbi:MAG: XTP/dITP diphosphatase [Acidobacteriota bacterium]